MVTKLALRAVAKVGLADCRAGFVPHAEEAVKSAKTVDPLPNDNLGDSVKGLHAHLTGAKCGVQVLAPRFLQHCDRPFATQLL